jgi:ubiquinone/menaquinone biosynthesis C-methylase UbiE
VSAERERLSATAWAPPWVRHEHLARYLFARDLISGGTVIDCASGDGTSAKLLAERAERVLGFDVAEDAVRDAQAAAAPSNVTYAVGDATQLPVADGTASAYVSLETIEHVPDAEALVREAARVLDDAGVFVCSTPDRDVYSPGNGADDKPWNQFHVREFSQEEFVSLLERFFDSVELYGQNRRSRHAAALKGWAGRHISSRGVVLFNQASKLPRLLHDTLDRHRAVPVDPRARYEILVAVCTKAKQPAQQ